MVTENEVLSTLREMIQQKFDIYSLNVRKP